MKINYVTLDSMISERTSKLLFELRQNNKSYNRLIEEINQKYNDLKNDDKFNTFKELLEIYEKRNDVESKYLYCQGHNDNISISGYLKNEFIDNIMG